LGRGGPRRPPGKPPLPIPEPLVGSVAELLRRTVDFSPEQVGFLQYGRVADTTAAREQLGFSPKWSSPHAFEDFAASRLRKLVTQEQVATAQREALAVLRRAAGWLADATRPGGAR
jgi:UDP-glucose 4-epimerase